MQKIQMFVNVVKQGTFVISSRVCVLITSALIKEGSNYEERLHKPMRNYEQIYTSLQIVSFSVF